MAQSYKKNSISSQTLVDLSRLLLPSTVELHGFDISDELFPSTERLPPKHHSVNLGCLCRETFQSIRKAASTILCMSGFLLTIVRDNDPFGVWRKNSLSSCSVGLSTVFSLLPHPRHWD